MAFRGRTGGTVALAIALVVLGAFSAWGGGQKEPIKVGAPTPLTGPYVSDGLGMFQGIEFAVDELNQKGGLLGKPLKIVKFDTADFAPEVIMQAADQLVGQDKVDSVHGGWAGWGADVKAFGKYDVPFFMSDGSISSIEVIRENPAEYDNVFQLDDVERAYAEDMMEVMNALPFKYPNKTVAIIVADDAWGRETAEGLKARALKLGWEVPILEIVPYETREWGPILSKIRAANPGYIHVEIISPPDVITFFRQFLKAPTQSLLNFGYSIMPPDFLKNMGAEADGIMGETYGLPFPKPPTPATEEWLKKFRAKYGSDPQSAAFATYTGVMIWAAAVKAVGNEKDYKAINRHIAATPYKGIEGGTWKFDQDHKIPVSPDVPTLHLQIQGGKLVTVFTGANRKYGGYEWLVPPWIKQ